MTEFRGFVSHIIYRNEENGYTVFEITLTGTGEKKEKADTAFEPFGADVGDVITCVGYPVSISEGEGCAVTGEYTTHPVYGEQLEIRR